MTRDQVRIGITVSSCYGSEMGIPLYSEEDLMESFDDMYFNNPDFYCEDCISRKDALNVLYKYGGEYFPLSTALKIENDIKNIPSVQPKPKTDVLDKIRAEIADLEIGISRYHYYRPWIFRDEVLEIIDKYKAESEVQNDLPDPA